MSGCGWICLSCLAPWRQSEVPSNRRYSSGATHIGDVERNRQHVVSVVDIEVANDRAMIASRKPQELIECSNATEARLS
jgi:hypothetical protein